MEEYSRPATFDLERALEVYRQERNAKAEKQGKPE